jgi:hypothetical protein
MVTDRAVGSEPQANRITFGVLNSEINTASLSEKVNGPALVQHKPIYFFLRQREPPVQVKRLAHTNVIYRQQLIIDKQLILLRGRRWIMRVRFLFTQLCRNTDLDDPGRSDVVDIRKEREWRSWGDARHNLCRHSTRCCTKRRTRCGRGRGNWGISKRPLTARTGSQGRCYRQSQPFPVSHS